LAAIAEEPEEDTTTIIQTIAICPDDDNISELRAEVEIDDDNQPDPNNLPMVNENNNVTFTGG
jgi:hypothetical protein